MPDARTGGVDPQLLRHADLMQRLPSLHDGLRSASDVAALLARGTELAQTECRFARGVVVGVRDGRLTADATDVLGVPASDALRRRLISEAPALDPGGLEAELLRRPEATLVPSAQYPSQLAALLDLESPVFGVIAPEGSAVGFLLMDRPELPLDDTERTIVRIFGRMLSVVLEHVVLRARIAELSRELRFMTVSAQALATEAFEGAITLPVHGRHMPSFRAMETSTPNGAARARRVLSAREIEIATLMAQGRSNKEIAERLFLSADTVKDIVARVVRKLGAANRIDAVVRFLGHEVHPDGGR
jgi:DNA-binding CsgD family transcriptional regulator